MSLSRRATLRLAAAALAAPVARNALAAMYSADTKPESYTTGGDPTKIET